MSARDVLASVLTFPGGGLLADAQMAALDAAGYVVVPKEPTMTMIGAGVISALDARETKPPGRSELGSYLMSVYRAMLAAAQEPTS